MRSLIVSYSYSGNTHRIAREIQTLTGGDWCEIYPWQPYPAAFPELLQQVKKEVSTQYHPRLLPPAYMPQPYPVIFVGSPNWCGTIAPPLTAWLKENNMAGKILLPFFSHCGGEDKGMEQAVRDLCPEAKIGSSLYVLENRRENLQDMVQAWLEQNFPENHS